jgi:hypothetical protein
MSSSKKLLQSASGYINQTSGGDNVEDYFDVTFWEGTGSSNTNIRTGVDLSSSGNGGMVMIKSAIQRDWSITDTVRGVNSQITANRGYAQTTETDHVTHFLDYGFTLGANERVNRSGTNSLAFTFQKKSKFFDIQTWTGNGTAGRTISHNLGQTPSMIWIQRLDQNASFMVWHKSLPDPTINGMYLDADNANTSNTNYWNSTAPTSTTLTVGSHYNINWSGGSYVAYFFGDYEDENSLISSGTFTGQGMSYVDVNVGFEPQWILMKRYDGNGNWICFNHKTGLVNEEPYTNDHDAPVYLNHDYGWSEANWGVSVKADGFRVQGNNISASGHYYIYTAIRRPFMGEPTDYREVFSYQNNASQQFSTGVPAFGRNGRNPADFGFYCNRSNGEFKFGARILQKNELTLRTSTPMDSPNNYHPKYDSMFNLPQDPGQTRNGIANHRSDYGWWSTYYSNVDAWSFTRWKGICDIQTYRTTGSNITLKHNLGAVPEFMAVKGLYGGSGGASDWRWYHKDMVAGNTNPQYYLTTNTNAGATNSGYSSASVWQNTTPTDEQVYIGTDAQVNSTVDQACVWIGFASYEDRVDVGYYTGDGTFSNSTYGRDIQTNLNANGYIRMVLVKPVSQAGGWYWTDYASHGYYWMWNRNLGRISSSPRPALSCSFYGGAFRVYTSITTNHEYSALGNMPLNKSGVRYVYVAFG